MSCLLSSKTIEDQTFIGHKKFKTRPNLDENFFQILYLAQFDLGSHK